MSQAFPTGGFEWIDPDTACQVLQQPADAEKGYIPEVDLEYPEELHNMHNAYALAPECVKIEATWMSDYQPGLLKEMYKVRLTR